MNIWDKAVEDAEGTPRALFAEALARADNIKVAALVYLEDDDRIQVLYGWKPDEKVTTLSVIGLFHSAIVHVTSQQADT